MMRMKRTDEKNNNENSEEKTSKLRYWDKLLDNLYIILGVMFVVSIPLGLSESMSDPLSIVACTSLGTWILRELAEQKIRNGG